MQNTQHYVVPKLCRQINKFISNFGNRNYMSPKPIDIAIKELTKYYLLGGCVFVKLDGTRSYLTCYEQNVYNNSTRGQQQIIESSVHDHKLFAIVDIEREDNTYYAFDIVILHGIIVAHRLLKII